MEVTPVTAVPAPSTELKFAPSKEPYTESCPHCRAPVTTTTRYVCGMMNFVLFIACLFFPCLICIFWLPCFMDVEHSCPTCKRPISKADRL